MNYETKSDSYFFFRLSPILCWIFPLGFSTLTDGQGAVETCVFLFGTVASSKRLKKTKSTMFYYKEIYMAGTWHWLCLGCSGPSGFRLHVITTHWFILFHQPYSTFFPGRRYHHLSCPPVRCFSDSLSWQDQPCTRCLSCTYCIGRRNVGPKTCGLLNWNNRKIWLGLVSPPSLCSWNDVWYRGRCWDLLLDSDGRLDVSLWWLTPR